jgi:hypothetical protein
MGLDTKAVAALSNPSFEVFQAADILQGFRRAVKFQDFRLANVLLFSSRTRSISPSLTLPLAAKARARMRSMRCRVSPWQARISGLRVQLLLAP